jgi:hypothetical protein
MDALEQRIIFLELQETNQFAFYKDTNKNDTNKNVQEGKK